MSESLDDLRKQMKELVEKIRKFKGEFEKDEILTVNWTCNKYLDKNIAFSMGDLLELVEFFSSILGIHAARLIYEVREDLGEYEAVSVSQINKFMHEVINHSFSKFLEFQNLKESSKEIN